MASSTSDWYSISGHPSRKYRAYVNAYVESETDTTATIYVEGCVQAKYMSEYGARVRVYVNGVEVDATTVAIHNSSGEAGNWGTASGALVVEKTSDARSVTCKCAVEGETVDGYGGVNGGSPVASVGVSVSAFAHYPPNVPANLVATRESDNKNVLTWETPETSDTQPCLYIGVYRRVDGGEWSQIASIPGNSTSYNDTTTAADHYYAYRVRAWNTAGYSDYATSETTYNTPAAPTKVRAYRTDATTVKVEVTNSARTATALDLQRSTDGEEWSTVATVSGAPATETSDRPGGGTFYYRARNTRGSLASDWSPVSNGVVTIVPPAAPTLKSPASGVVVSKAQETVTFEWAHNPVDGSAQTAAELRYSTNGGSMWETVTVSGNGASYGLTNAFAVNSTVTWGVRTKGAHADYGPWSGNRTFTVYQEPTVAFAQPADGFVVENTPIAIQLQYEDPSGDLVSAALAISDGSRVVWSRTVAGLSYEITSDEWVPDNEATYYLTAEVRSSSSLTASASREFATAFVPPIPAAVDVEYDVETSFASLSAYLWQPLPVTWDGDMTGLESVFSLQRDVWFCKVSEDAPSVEEVVGGTVFLASEHVPAQFVVGEQNIEQLSGGFSVNSESPELSFAVVSVTDSSMPLTTYVNGDFTEVITLTHGLWFIKAACFYASSLTGPSAGSSGGSSITWDGDTTGLESYDDEGTMFYKVYEGEVPSSTEMVGQTITWFMNFDESIAGELGVPAGESLVSDEITQDYIFESEGYYRVIGNVGATIFITADNAEVSNSSLTNTSTLTRGIYFLHADMTAAIGVAAISYTSEITLPEGYGSTSEPEEPKSISVYREVNGERVLLGEGLQPGAGLVDRYAPVNVDYNYVTVAVADSGAVNTRYIPARIDSQWFYFIFGDNVAKGRINPEGTKKLTRPNRRRRHLAGRPSPVSFDDGSVSDTRSVSVLLRSKEEADAFAQMMWESGRCVYKSADGEVIHADVELSDKPAWVMPTYYGSIAVSLTRIDGRAL